ncbi:Tim44 domain-containing protein [Castellaniella sp.]|uniref:Tim44 domain-containing protein n=1 Tax=Castellaniella sp. TaxID=1955812 RepID=UPI00355F7414
MNQSLARLLPGLLLMLAALAMLTVTHDAEARRLGGGLSFGRQSTNIMKQRQAVTPPAARSTPQSAAPVAGAAGARAAGASARSGMSRWLGPIAGIAAGLGIAALLSSLGLSGALLEFLSSALLIGLVIFAVMFLVRRLRASQQPMATARAGGHAGAASQSYRQAHDVSSPGPSAGAAPVIEAVASTTAHDASWFIPADFDVPVFLEQAKQQFIRIQTLWDAGDRDQLGELLTDDMLVEITPSLPHPDEGNHTEVVLLNAELMGIEAVAGGHLASVRYSGMLRESAGAEASRFEEVWNLYKAQGAGWLLAGIQQIEPR